MARRQRDQTRRSGDQPDTAAATNGHPAVPGDGRLSPSVDELATMLRAVVEVGIDHTTPDKVGALLGLRCVQDRAHETSEDGQTAAAREVIRAALDSLGEGNYGRAARLLFGATNDTRGQPARERRRLAAYQIDVLPDWFRRRYQRQILGEVAAEILNIEHATTTEDHGQGDNSAADSSAVAISDDTPGTGVVPVEGQRRSPVSRVHRVLMRVRHPLTAEPAAEGSPVVLATTPRLAVAQPRQLVGVLRGLRDQQARPAWHLVWIAGGVVVFVRYGRDGLLWYVLVLAALGFAKTAVGMFREWQATRSLALGESWPRLVIFACTVFITGEFVIGQDDNEPVAAVDCELWQAPCDDDLTTTTAATGAAGTPAPTTTTDPHPSPYYTPTTYADPPTEASEPACPPAARSRERRLAFTDLPPLCINPDNRYAATIRTNYGQFTVTLNTQAAPYTVNNFVYLARWGFYDGVQLIPSPIPIEPEPLPTEVWTHLASGHPTSPAVAGSVGVPGYGLTFESHQGDYPDDQTFYLVMTNPGQPDRFAVIVTPEGHEDVADAAGAYPLLGVVDDRCREVIAQRDFTGGWDVGPKSEPIVIETITITEETGSTTTRPPTSNDPCGRLAAAQDD